MFIRPCYRTKNGKRHAYWALMESYRTERGPRQRVVAYLGRLDEAGRLGVKQAAEGKRDSQQTLFPEPEPRWVEVDTSAVRVENCRSFGGVWLAWELIRKLSLDTFFQKTIPKGREDVPWGVTALILVIARLCEPSSELHIAEHFYRKTALCDLLGTWFRDASPTDFNSVARRHDDVDCAQFFEFFQHAAGFVAQTCLSAQLSEGLPQHVRQKANQNVRQDAVFFLVPDGPDAQIAFLNPKRGFRFGQLHVRLPEVLIAPVGHVAAQ